MTALLFPGQPSPFPWRGQSQHTTSLPAGSAPIPVVGNAKSSGGGFDDLAMPITDTCTGCFREFSVELRGPKGCGCE